MKKGLDLLVILLDESGSMQGKLNDTRGGLEALFKEQEALEGRDVRLTMAAFNTRIRQIYQGVKPPFTVPPLMPSGSTSLNDSACILIDDIGRELAALPEAERPEKVIFTIITDGEENASKLYTKAQLLQKIKVQQAVYKWIFHFVGPDPSQYDDVLTLQHRTYFDDKKIGSTYSNYSTSVSSHRTGRP